MKDLPSYQEDCQPLAIPEKKKKSITSLTFQSLMEKITENDKDANLIMGLEKYLPNKLGIQELFEEVDEESNTLSDIPLQMLSRTLRMDLEGRNSLQSFEEKNITKNEQ